MKFCESCGGKLPDGAKFCPECGTKVVHPYEFEPKEPAPVPQQPSAFIGMGFGMNVMGGSTAVPPPGYPAFGGADPIEEAAKIVAKKLAENTPYEEICASLEKQIKNLRDGGERAAEFVSSQLLAWGTDLSKPFYQWMIAQYRTGRGESEK